ncbi:hypothetical protein DB346_19605 [Verrucomicrobia bacterium LW23]|nr:hypothetical protein DB346_19605 [Verrucomicrobia bacterium LW23]
MLIEAMFAQVPLNLCIGGGAVHPFLCRFPDLVQNTLQVVLQLAMNLDSGDRNKGIVVLLEKEQERVDWRDLDNICGRPSSICRIAEGGNNLIKAIWSGKGIQIDRKNVRISDGTSHASLAKF